MDLELAQVAAGLPVAASFAMAGGLTAIRGARRRTALNEAMHELRRPLQALALALPADPAASGPSQSSLRLAVAAVDRLDREINGRDISPGCRRISLRPLVDAAAARWQGRANIAGRSLELRWRLGEAFVEGDEIELSQAVDNMISNALEHGRGDVRVEVSEDDRYLRLAVVERIAGGGGGAASSGRPGFWAGGAARSERPGFWVSLSGRRRHGHGLRVVMRIAANHGGTFQLHRSLSGSKALLLLPTIGQTG